MSAEMEKALQTVSELYAKYAADEYMSAKTHHYICTHLPNILENIRKTHDQNQQRIQEMVAEQQQFIHTFLYNNRYFYVSATEKFFYYDGKQYSQENEDSILHDVLTTITREKNLMSWKKSTKVYVMKRIKENSLLTSVPESETIQCVLDALCPALFSTRVDAKYFLTILGDNLFRKHGDLTHIISSKSKPFIREIVNISQFLLGTNAGTTFKHKYHEQHDYPLCRMVRINDSVATEPVWGPMLKEYGLDMLCVAAHYSARYGSADMYVVNDANDDELFNYVFYLKHHNQLRLVEEFCTDYLYISTKPGGEQISWNNMQYLWKLYLDNKNLPAIMFQQTLKRFLTNRYSTCYEVNLDTFLGISSKFLPLIDTFITFWEKTVQYDETSGEMGYEIDELCALYKNWCRQTDNNGAIKGMTEKRMLDLITFYFPQVEVEDDKYIVHIRCSLWDKQTDIQLALEQLREEYRRETFRRVSVDNDVSLNVPDGTSKISMYNAYVWYCRNRSSQEPKLVASKQFFEKYVGELLNKYIVDGTFISGDWLK